MLLLSTYPMFTSPYFFGLFHSYNVRSSITSIYVMLIWMYSEGILLYKLRIVFCYLKHYYGMAGRTLH